MDWDPNEDGIIWFLREIYPRIRQEMPGAKFSIVDALLRHACGAIATGQPGVELLAGCLMYDPIFLDLKLWLSVAGWWRHAYQNSEAMAMAKAVVFNAGWRRGSAFPRRTRNRIAERPEQFAQSVVQLLKNSSLRTSIGTAARQAAVRHNWAQVVVQLERVLESVARSNRVIAA